jgi:hypothetical protein
MYMKEVRAAMANAISERLLRRISSFSGFILGRNEVFVRGGNNCDEPSLIIGVDIVLIALV